MNDAAAIAQLSDQLGYSATADETARCVLDLSGRHDHAVYVAAAGGSVVGWIHIFLSYTLLAEARTEVAGLVVDERHRGAGIGRALMLQAERWAQEHGCQAVRLRSNVLRADAHAFYQRLGYEATKVQKLFMRYFS